MTDIRQARPTTIATACCLCEVDIDANTVAVWYGSQKAHTAMIGSQGKAVGVALPIIAAATKNYNINKEHYKY